MRTVCLHRWVGLAVVMGAAAAQPAQAETASAVRLDLTAGGGVETNPFLTNGQNRESGFVDVEARPVVKLSEDRGETTLEGYYRRKEYLARYRGTDGFGFITRSAYRPDERTRLTSSIVYDNAILDAQSLFGSGVGGFETTTTGVTPQPTTIGTTGVPAGDVGLIGLRQRRSQLLADVTLSFKPGQRDDWSLDFQGVRADYPGATTVSNYSSYGLSGTYTRLLNEKNSVGVTVGAQETRFDGFLGPARVVSAQLVYQMRLPRSWSLNLSGGASFLSGDGAAAVGQSTSAVFQAELCSRGERLRTCFSASRTVAPSGADGIGPILTARVLLDYRFSRLSNLSIEGNLSSNDRTTISNVNLSERFYTVNVTYNRGISERLQLVAGARYDRREGGNSQGIGAGSLRVGIAVALGKLR